MVRFHEEGYAKITEGLYRFRTLDGDASTFYGLIVNDDDLLITTGHSLACTRSRVDSIPCRLLDGQHQGICLWKDLIFGLTWNLEPFTTVFDNSVVYRDFPSAANEVQRSIRGSK